MKKKLKLKPFVLPIAYSIFVVTLLMMVFLSRKNLIKSVEDDTMYVTGSILDSYVPVMNLETKLIRPYTDESVTIGKDFYSYEDDQTTQTNSIIYYENTYMQNSGVDYKSENTFDIIAILPGEVIEVKKEELLGNIITIRHENDIISVYQSLEEVNVQKGDQVSQGQIIGKSGTSDLNKELQNHVHFELIIQGQIKDPEAFFDKKINEIDQ